jgi:SAM-dependent methyltransferase
MMSTQVSVEALHDYWRAPNDGWNRPADYRYGVDRSLFLLALLARHSTPIDSVLELGSGIGRNLHYLYETGYRDLSGIEINPQAIKSFRVYYPETARCARVYCRPIEETLAALARVDVIITMAVLQHIHPDSEWIFGEMARMVNRVLVTIEDEQRNTWRHVPRNYQQIFEHYGFGQVESKECNTIKGLGAGFVARIFTPIREHEHEDIGIDSGSGA